MVWKVATNLYIHICIYLYMKITKATLIIQGYACAHNLCSRSRWDKFKYINTRFIYYVFYLAIDNWSDLKCSLSVIRTSGMSNMNRWTHTHTHTNTRHQPNGHMNRNFVENPVFISINSLLLFIFLFFLKNGQFSLAIDLICDYETMIKKIVNKLPRLWHLHVDIRSSI